MYMYNYDYPPRVTQDIDGHYRWYGVIDQSNRKRIAKFVMLVEGLICLSVTIFCVVLGRGDLSMILIPGAISLFVMGMTAFLCYIYFERLGDIYQPYEMSDSFIHWIGTYRNDAYMYFHEVKAVRTFPEEHRIEMDALLLHLEIYIPEEDYAFVERYILRRVAEHAVK